jgi:hypothetical protein
MRLQGQRYVRVIAVERRTLRWWALTLSCGHTVLRHSAASHPQQLPQKSHCDQCPPVPDKQSCIPAIKEMRHG